LVFDMMMMRFTTEDIYSVLDWFWIYPRNRRPPPEVGFYGLHPTSYSLEILVLNASIGV